MPVRRKFIFALPVYLERILVKIVYEGHRVKVKVTGATKVENPYSCCGDVNLLPVLL